jgi:hypothetical protein
MADGYPSGRTGTPEEEAVRLRSLFSVENLTRSSTRRSRRWVAAVLVAALVTSTCAIVLALRTTADAHSYPAAWGSPVAPFAAIVEQTRDLRFDHPVFVDFLDSKQFRADTAEADAVTLAQDRARVEREVGLLTILGLVPGEVDLFNDADQLRGSGQLVSYSYLDEHIRVRGEELTPAVQAELVGALAQALQDQHFGVGARLREVSADADKVSALQALALGDAARVEEVWLDSLSPAEQAEIADDRVRLGAETGDEASRVPGVVKALVGIPGEFGEVMVEAALSRGGQRAVDDLFLVPPTTAEQLLDPWAMVQDHQGYLDVRAPGVPDDSTETATGTLGAIFWLALLAERLPASRALDAAYGWGGDTFVTYDSDGTSCVRVRYAADGPGDLAEMESALAAWSRRAPDDEGVTVRGSGRHLLVQSCAPSSEVPRSHSHGPRQAVDLAVARSRLSVDLVRQKVEVPVARCGAAMLLPGPDVPADAESSVDRSAKRRVLKACTEPTSGHAD